MGAIRWDSKGPLSKWLVCPVDSRTGMFKLSILTRHITCHVVFQFFASIAQPIFQIMGPIYSETWFDLKGRTTATMIVAIGMDSYLLPTFSDSCVLANPFGGALGQLLSPIVGDTRKSVSAFLDSSSCVSLSFILDPCPWNYI